MRKRGALIAELHTPAELRAMTAETKAVPASLVLENWLNGSVMKSLSEGNMQDAMAAMMGQAASKFMTSDGDSRVEGQDGLGRQDYGNSSEGPGKGHYLNPRQELVRLPDTAHGAPLQPAYTTKTQEPPENAPKPKKIKLDADVRTLIF